MATVTTYIELNVNSLNEGEFTFNIDVEEATSIIQELTDALNLDILDKRLPVKKTKKT